MNKIAKKNYHYSLFGRFLSLISLVFISLVFCVGWKLTKIRSELIHHNILQTSRHLNQLIESNIYYTENKICFISTLIANQDISKDYSKILNLLGILTIDSKSQITPWSTIGWADDNYKIQLTNAGILSTPIDISSKPYIKDLNNKPFTLLFDTLETNPLNKQSIVPVAMGVKDQNGKYLGCITSGIDVVRLGSLIDSYLQNNKVHYAIINTLDDKLIIQSSRFNRDLITKELTLFSSSDSEEQSSDDKKKSYVASRITKSPFILVVGTEHTAMNYEDYYYSLIPYKFELVFITSILFLLIYLFYISILNPFMTLAKAALAISNGDVEIEIEDIASKEGAQVASALEQIKHSLKTERELVNELSEARNSLAITNLRLENKVVERTKELENSLAAKTSFFDHLNHKIISPLQGIGNISESLITLWHEIDEIHKFEYASQIAYTSNRLLSMVGNLLDLSKFSNSKIHLNLTKIDLSSLIEEAINECKTLYMSKKSIQIHFSNSKPIHVIADKERITQVLRNLLLNSIKFSPNNGDVAIAIIPTSISIKGSYRQAVHFTIHDRGIGLDEAEMANIFSPFIQGKNANSGAGSIGLGLTICKEIITSHHGKIWAANNKDGGATFNFILPLVQPTEQEEKYRTPGEKDLHHAIPNILIIDDEEVCLNSMELLLHNSRYNLIKANSGQTGLKYLHHHHRSISLIMLDLMMPDMYGLNVLSEIKKDPNLAHIPIILQTGTSDEEEIVKAFDMGVLSFVRKPYKKKVVLAEIEKALAMNSKL